MAGSVLEVSVAANKQIIEKLMGDDIMFETLMEIMEPRIMEAMEPRMEEIRIKSRMEGREEGIHGAIKVIQTLNHSDEEIKSAIIKQYGLTGDEADKYL